MIYPGLLRQTEPESADRPNQNKAPSLNREGWGNLFLQSGGSLVKGGAYYSYLLSGKRSKYASVKIVCR